MPFCAAKNVVIFLTWTQTVGLLCAPSSIQKEIIFFSQSLSPPWFPLQNEHFLIERTKINGFLWFVHHVKSFLFGFLLKCVMLWPSWYRGWMRIYKYQIFLFDICESTVRWIPIGERIRRRKMKVFKWI